jgi:TonB family protein
MKALADVAAMAMLFLSLPSATAQQSAAPSPKVMSASVPFYPQLARQTRIQGVVTLRVSTDGKKIAAVEGESGPRLLVQAAKDNLKTWEFEPHAPTNFQVTFRYTLFVPECDSECKCDSGQKESVLLQLPSNVELSADTLLTCDPAVTISKRKRDKRK